jgi:glycosyltransferase involved in cell wall biosynthesis
VALATGQIAERVASPAHRSGAAPHVSVVISTRDRAHYLGELLDALEAQDVGLAGFEVIVVDDGSQDDTWKVLCDAAATRPLSLAALRLRCSTGQGWGRNAGVDDARGEVVAFTDDDCIPSPEWLRVLTTPYACGTGGPRPLVVQGRTTPCKSDSDSGPWARAVWVLRPTWLFETCNIAYRRDDLTAIGGFPSRAEAPTTANGKTVGEDALLGWKVMERGPELIFAAEAEVAHRNEPASYLEWLAGHRGRAVFPDLVRRSPHGARALWHGWFLAPRTVAFEIALASALAGLLRRRASWGLGLLPWLWLTLPEAHQRSGRHPLVRLAQLAAGDLVGLGALLAGSLRHRRLVL